MRKIAIDAGAIVIKVLGDVSEFVGKLSSIGKTAQTGLKVATAAIAATSAALVGAGAAAIKVGSEFETSLAKVGTIADTSKASMEDMSAAVLDLSNETGKAATDLNEAVYQAISGGVDTAEAVSFVGDATKLAVGGFTETSTAVDILTTTMNAYGDSAGTASEISDMLIQTQNLGKTTVDELASSMGKVIPVASAYGIGLDDLSASYATLTAGGIDTAEATTYMKSMFNELGDSGSNVSAVLSEKTGKSFAQLMDEGYSLGDVMQVLSDSVDGDTGKFNELWSSSEAGVGALGLLNAGSEAYNETLAKMQESAGSTEEAYNTMNDTLEHQTELLSTGAQNLGIAIYEGLEAPLKDLAGMGVGYINELQTAMQEGGISGLASAAGGIMASFISEIAGYAPDVINAAVEIIASFLEGLTDNSDQMIDGAGKIVEALAEGIIRIAPLLANAGLQLMVSLAEYIIDSLPQIVDKGPDIISSLIDGISSALSALADAAGRIIFSLVSYIVSNLPQILAAGVKIVVSIKNGIFNVLGTLTSSALKIITAILAGIGQGTAKLVLAGVDIVKGIAKGIASGAKWAKDAIVNLAKSMLNSIKSFFGINSPSRVMKKLFEKDWTGGIVKGVQAGTSKVTDSVEAMSDAAYVTAVDCAEDFEDVGKNYVELLSYGIDSTVDTAEESAQSVIDAITETVDDNDLKSECKSFGSDAMSALKSALEDGAKEAQEVVEEKITSITEAIQDRYDDVIKAQEKMQEKLAGYGELTYEDESGKTMLSDLNDNISILEKYAALLEELKTRNVSKDLMSEMTDMNVDDAIAYAEQLVTLSDVQLEAYQAAYDKQQELSKEIASNFYADQLEVIEEDFTSQIDDALAEVPGMVSDIGVDTVNGWIQGMESRTGALNSAVRNIANQMLASMMSALDIHSPSKKTEKLVGVQAAAGVEIGFVERMKGAFGRMSGVLNDSVLQMGNSTAAEAEKDSAFSETRTVVYSKTTEKIPVIKFNGSLSALARVLKPYIDYEDNRTGPTLVTT